MVIIVTYVQKMFPINSTFRLYIFILFSFTSICEKNMYMFFNLKILFIFYFWKPHRFFFFSSLLRSLKMSFFTCFCLFIFLASSAVIFA